MNRQYAGADYAGLDEIVGAEYDEIVGADYDDYVGAAAPQRRLVGRLPYGSGPTQVARKTPRTVRQYPLGFVSLAVPAAGSVNVIARPQTIFRPQRLLIPSTVGANFVITDIRIGKNSQFVSATEIPATLFQETAVGVLLTLDTAQIGHDIELSVRNTDAVNPHDFRAAFFGAALE